MNGPSLRIVASCDKCDHIKITPYRVQGDSGCDVECRNPYFTGPRHIGESSFDSTPQWCPLLSSAMGELRRGLSLTPDDIRHWFHTHGTMHPIGTYERAIAGDAEALRIVARDLDGGS